MVLLFSWLITLFLLFASCTNVSVENKKELSFDDIKNASKGLDIETKMTLIPLEFTDECPIGQIDKVYFSKDYCFVKSENFLYQFYRDGKFMKQIGSIGDGPGEYVLMLDFSIDDNQKVIYISDLQQKVLKYNYENVFIGSFNINEIPLYTSFCEDNFIYTPLNLPGNNHSKLLACSTDGIVEKKWGNDIVYNNESGALYYQFKCFQNYENALIFNQLFNDTIYTYTGSTNQLDARYIINFGKDKISLDALGDSGTENPQNSYCYISDFAESADYLFLNIANKGRSEKYIIDKSNNKSYIDDTKRGIYIKKMNLYFWPLWVTEDENLITYFPYDHLNFDDNNIINEQFKEIISNMNEDSNPLLVSIKIKKISKLK